MCRYLYLGLIFGLACLESLESTKLSKYDSSKTCQHSGQVLLASGIGYTVVVHGYGRGIALNHHHHHWVLNEQLHYTETGCKDFGPGLEYVINMASSMANRPGYVTAFAVLPKLVS